MLICHLYIFFEEVPFEVFDQVFNPVVFSLLSFKSSLCNLEISPLLVCCNYFLPVCGLSSHPLDQLYF